MARYRSVVTSDRAVLELGSDWTASIKIGNDLRQILALVEKRMSVADICYHMHASPFHVYGLIFKLINQGFARVSDELPEPFSAIATDVDEMPEGVTEMVWSAERRLQDDPDAALDILHRVLHEDPKNKRAQELLHEAEEQFIKHVYERDLAPDDVPKIVMAS